MYIHIKCGLMTDAVMQHFAHCLAIDIIAFITCYEGYKTFAPTKPSLHYFKTMSMLQQHKYHYIQIVFIALLLALCIQQSKVVTAHLAAGPHSQGASTGVASLPI